MVLLGAPRQLIKASSRPEGTVRAEKLPVKQLPALSSSLPAF